ncbi:hypothetical protein Tco_0180085 [Tanacetum coccineum]
MMPEVRLQILKISVANLVPLEYHKYDRGTISRNDQFAKVMRDNMESPPFIHRVSSTKQVGSREGTDISQKDEKPSKKRQNQTRDGKVCEDEAQSKSSQLREEKAKKNIT